MTSVFARVRCEFCGNTQPRKHWKATPELHEKIALCCTTCGRKHGYWPVNYERTMRGPNGNGRIA